MFTKYLESTLKEEDACYVEDVAAGKGWLHLIKKGQIFRILDLKGNQAVDTLFINANDPSERYSVQQRPVGTLQCSADGAKTGELLGRCWHEALF